jgi:hypothetical protein
VPFGLQQKTKIFPGFSRPHYISNKLHFPSFQFPFTLLVEDVGDGEGWEVENAIKALGILFQRRANKIYEGP